MELHQVQELLSSINGCTFASLDAETVPSAGFRKVIENERVILFTNKTGSGYENMVRRRLKSIGRNPNSFVLGDLPFGERVPETPLIEYKGLYYLQTIQLVPGKVRTFLGSEELTMEEVEFMFKRRPSASQGLPSSDQVVVHTYRLENLTAIRLLGEEVLSEIPRPSRAKKSLSLTFRS